MGTELDKVWRKWTNLQHYSRKLEQGLLLGLLYRNVCLWEPARLQHETPE